MTTVAIKNLVARFSTALLVALALASSPAWALTLSASSLTLTQGGNSATITVSGASGALSAVSSNPSLGSSVSNPAIADAGVMSATSIKVTSVSAGYTVVTIRDAISAVRIPVTVVTPAGASTNRYNVLAWNDLGMHCMDGKDYSVFSILPPFNNLNAQLIDRAAWSGPVAPASLSGSTTLSGAYLTYESVVDALMSSINTYSGGVGDERKTNFWNNVKSLYGAQPLDNCGLTGNRTPGTTPSKMAFNKTWSWFEATGLPITPLSENLTNASVLSKNEYPPVKVVARSSKGTELASTVTVLPVSDEISCRACHASTSPASQSTANGKLARPDRGWVNLADVEKDWKFNILRRHDELSGTSLERDAIAGKPALCAGCHGSNALGLKPNGAKAWLTSAMHANHAYVTDPSSGGVTLNDSTNRNSCYSCHPGSTTKCLRGAMSNVSGVECQSCHGSMSKVGDPARVGWLEQPNCQACHNNGKRLTSAVDGSGNLLTTTDTRFASNPNTPSTGFSLFRYSKGHGGMKCESCHGATHAEYPSVQPSDNLQSVALQGYQGTVMECVVCHNSPPEDSKLNLGPHGMHWTGPTWVGKHNDFGKTNPASCKACHGADYRGSALSQVKAPRSFRTKNSGVKSYSISSNPATSTVGCYDCHNGPNPS